MAECEVIGIVLNSRIYCKTTSRVNYAVRYTALLGTRLVVTWMVCLQKLEEEYYLHLVLSSL